MMMDFAKKNWWWIVALLIGALGAYLAFQPTEKEIQLARARAAKAAKAAGKTDDDDDTIDTAHEVVEEQKSESGGTI